MSSIQVQSTPESQYVIHSPLLRGNSGSRVAGAKLLVGGDGRGESLLKIEEAEGRSAFFMFGFLDDDWSGNDSFFLSRRTYYTPPTC